jgi:hypothetical protein
MHDIELAEIARVEDVATTGFKGKRRHTPLASAFETERDHLISSPVQPGDIPSLSYIKGPKKKIMQDTFTNTDDTTTTAETQPSVTEGCDPTFDILPAATPFSNYCNTHFWRLLALLGLFELMVTWHDLWDPLEPTNS